MTATESAHSGVQLRSGTRTDSGLGAKKNGGGGAGKQIAGGPKDALNACMAESPKLPFPEPSYLGR